MDIQGNDVRVFFDEIADKYSDKYSSRDAFLQYFFNERLAEAVQGIDFNRKTVLDIGAGTGNLFDRISRIQPDIEYYGTDISSKMLRQSAIPPDKTFVGYCYDSNFPVDRFDYVYMLGVSTYLDNAELEKTLKFISSVVDENSKVIITFTNERSLDWKLRKAFKLLGKKLPFKRYVLAQGFNIFPKRLNEICEILDENFEICETRWLNHTVFPFNRLAKNFSVRIAKKIHKLSYGTSFFEYFSSDVFLVVKPKVK